MARPSLQAPATVQLPAGPVAPVQMQKPENEGDDPAGALAHVRELCIKEGSTTYAGTDKLGVPAGGERPWVPYEETYKENGMVLPFIPRKFYQLRWALMRWSPLCRRFFRGQFTYGEALVCFALFAQMAWILLHWILDTDGFRRNVRTTGHVSSLILMTTYVIAMHNNSVILLALGLPFDRSLPWHKLLAASSIFNSLVHALAFYLNGRNDTMPDADKSHHIMKMNKAYGMEISGWALLASMAAMSSLAVPWVAKRCFTVFYRTHVIFALLTGILALFHGFGSAVWNDYVPMSIPGALFWFLDLLIRFFFLNCLTTVKCAKLRLIPAASSERAPVVEFAVPNSKRMYTAGQWVFICIPKLGILHWHPFTISSASMDKDMTLHFVCGGKWTGDVARLAAKHGEVRAYVEGPYGAPMIDVHSERYKCFLIVSSGLGWTFLRAFKRQLLQDGARGRNIKAVSSVAILRRDDDFQLPEFSGWGCAIADRAKFDAELQEDIYLTGKPKHSEVDDSDANPNPLVRGDPVLASLNVSEGSAVSSVNASKVDNKLLQQANESVKSNCMEAPPNDRHEEAAMDSLELPMPAHLHRAGWSGVVNRKSNSIDRGPSTVEAGSGARLRALSQDSDTLEAELRRLSHDLPRERPSKDARADLPVDLLKRACGEVQEGVCHKTGRPDLPAIFDAAAAQAQRLGEHRVAVLVCGNHHVLDGCLAQVGARQGGPVRFDVHFEAFGF